MTDFPNKIVTIILVFIMFVLAPVLWSYVRAEMKSDRLVLNEMSSFIDKVTDKATITEQDIDDLYLGVNAAGGTFDITVKKYKKVSIPDENNLVKTVYMRDDKDSGAMDVGDVVKVSVKEVGMSPTKRLLWSLLRLDSGSSKFSLAGTVR